MFGCLQLLCSRNTFNRDQWIFLYHAAGTLINFWQIKVATILGFRASCPSIQTTENNRRSWILQCGSLNFTYFNFSLIKMNNSLQNLPFSFFWQLPGPIRRFGKYALHQVTSLAESYYPIRYRTSTSSAWRQQHTLCYLATYVPETAGSTKSS